MFMWSFGAQLLPISVAVSGQYRRISGTLTASPLYPGMTQQGPTHSPKIVLNRRLRVGMSSRPHVVWHKSL